MSFYAFRLNSIFCNYQRGKQPDNDVLTFQVFSNKTLCGQGAITLNAVTSGNLIQLVPPPSTTYTFTPLAPNYKDRINDAWIIGPIDVNPSDSISILYTATNTSDSDFNPDEVDRNRLEIQLLERYYQALLSVAAIEVGGLVGAAIDLAAEIFKEAKDPLSKLSSTFKEIADVISDPVATLLGHIQDASCNGVVFAGVYTLSGEELDKLTYSAPTQYISLDRAHENTVSVHLTDASNHDTGNCGHVAETDISFSILALPILYGTLKDNPENLHNLPKENPAYTLREYVAGHSPAERTIGSAVKDKKTPLE